MIKQACDFSKVVKIEGYEVSDSVSISLSIWNCVCELWPLFVSPWGGLSQRAASAPHLKSKTQESTAESLTRVLMPISNQT